MIDLDRWQEILYTLGKHKLRTALTAFGVFWGIFMLVALLGAGNSLEKGTMQGFAGRTNAVFLWTAGGTQLPYQGYAAGRRIVLKDRDRDAVLAIPEVGLFSTFNNVGGWQVNQFVVRGDNSGSFRTRGVEPDQMHIGGYKLAAGRMLNSLDFEQLRKVVFIGTEVRDILFEEHENPLGAAVEIGGVHFTVIGVFEALDPNNHEMVTQLVMPNSTLRKAYNQSWYGHFEFAPIAGVSAIALEERVKTVLKELNRVHPEDNGAFGSFNMEREFNKIRGLFSGIKTFSWIVAIGTIIAGVVGVGNIMLIIVKERTREIGLQKALGATSWNVVGTILQESLVLTLIAGYLGLAAGVFALEGANALMAQGETMFAPTSFDFATALIALAVLVVAGGLAAVLPASRAALVYPIVALQDE